MLNKNIAIVVLAAGESSRFNGCKLIAKINGEPIINLAIDKACAVSESVIVITGARHETIQSFVDVNKNQNISLVYNQYWQQGMLTSIAQGIKALKCSTSIDGLVFMLADQIALTSEDLRCLIQQSNAMNLACANFENYLGAPIFVPQKDFQSLEQFCEESKSKVKGAKLYLQQNLARLVRVNMPNAIHDIDTKLDLKRWDNA